jgi:hypothetical protein
VAWLLAGNEKYFQSMGTSKYLDLTVMPCNSMVIELRVQKSVSPNGPTAYAC